MRLNYAAIVLCQLLFWGCGASSDNDNVGVRSGDGRSSDDDESDDADEPDAGGPEDEADEPSDDDGLQDEDADDSDDADDSENDEADDSSAPSEDDDLMATDEQSVDDPLPPDDEPEPKPPDGMDMMVEQDPPPDADDPLWLYVHSATHIIDVHNPSTAIGDLAVLYDIYNQKSPWSPSGRWVAGWQETGLLLYDLNAGSMVAREVPFAGLPSFYSWLTDDALLASDFSEDIAASTTVYVTTDGDVKELLPPFENSGIATTAILGGQYFVFAVAGSGDFPLYAMDVLAGSEPTLISNHPNTPMTYPVPSPNGKWLAYGSPGDTYSAYLWHPSLSTTVAGSEPMAGFTGQYSFSPDSSMFVNFSSGEEIRLTLQQLGDDGSLSEPVLLNAGSLAPPRWSPNSKYIYYAGETSVVQQVAPSIGEPLELPGYDYQCSVAWLGDDEFVYSSCSLDTGTGALNMVKLSGDGLTSTEVQFTPPHDNFVVQDGCMALYGPGYLGLGDLSDSLMLTDVAQAPTVVNNVAFAPDGSGVVWTHDGVEVYWQALDGCQPSGEAQLLERVSSAAQQLVFLPQ